MRSIEYLILLFPEKTGSEILEIQKQDKINDEKEYQDLHKKDLEFIKDINTNGGYYIYRFGVNQFGFLRAFNLRLEVNNIYMDVEKIVLFSRPDNENDFSVERKTKTLQKEDTYGLRSTNQYKRVTEKEWNEINEYLNSTTKFWNIIKQV